MYIWNISSYCKGKVHNTSWHSNSEFNEFPELLKGDERVPKNACKVSENFEEAQVVQHLM